NSNHRTAFPWIAFVPTANGIHYRAHSSTGQNREGSISADKAKGYTILPGWKGGVSIQIVDWIPSATGLTEYHPSRIQYGEQAPPSAIHLRYGSGAGVWLGLGERAGFSLGDSGLDVGYFPKRLVLPFALHLDRFTIDHYEGTRNPLEFSSEVLIQD